MKFLILAAIIGLSGCFGGANAGQSSDGEPEMFSVASADQVSGGNASAASAYPASQQWEPQNVIRVYSAPPNQYCPPCQRFNAWINSLTERQAEELSVQFLQISNHPAWVQTYPTLHWKVGDQWWKAEGWEGIEKFAITYNQSIKLGSKKKGSTSSAPALLDVKNFSASSSEQIPASSDAGQGNQYQSGTASGSFSRGKRRWR